jgi:hypothetical protein
VSGTHLVIRVRPGHILYLGSIAIAFGSAFIAAGLLREDREPTVLGALMICATTAIMVHFLWFHEVIVGDEGITVVGMLRLRRTSIPFTQVQQADTDTHTIAGHPCIWLKIVNGKDVHIDLMAYERSTAVNTLSCLQRVGVPLSERAREMLEQAQKLSLTRSSDI